MGGGLVAIRLDWITEKKFLDKIDVTDDPNDCWPWTASVDHRGYGQFRGNEVAMSRAHRVSWVLMFGQIPEDKLVLHNCHNRRCCNPAHLRLGTAQENTEDMMKAGRHVSGFKIMHEERKEALRRVGL
jgi:hypothetical protein